MDLRNTFKKKKIKSSVIVKGDKLIIKPVSEEVKAVIRDNYPNLVTSFSGDTLEITLSSVEKKRIKSNAVDQALEIIRNRIDEFGVAEPTIHKQGENEIVVQLPGVKDPKRAIELIGKTARLEFKLVDDESPIIKELPQVIRVGEEEELLKKFKEKIPKDDVILFGKTRAEGGTSYRSVYLLKRETLLTGDLLTEARVEIDPRYNEPYVSLSFNSAGAKIFEQITAEHIGKRLAIILDNTVYSAPVIRERISGGRAQITGGFTDREAKDIAIALRAGALPAPLKMLQNVTVGPSLGRDSIEAGIRAGIVGALLVISFMIFYYKLSGVIADFALFLNIIFLLGALSMFGATLTLPGIAGIILAIGLAVDTNVLMFERMREELRAGKTPRSAIDSGYDKAFWTIVDSHITTLITAAVLFQFGTGPIKGFAVTLGVGVTINLFTALIGTKTVFDYLYSIKKVRTLSI